MTGIFRVQVPGAPSLNNKQQNTMNTITFKRADMWLHSREVDATCTGTPIYYSLRILDAQGEEWDEVDETQAIYAEFQVEDFDGAHDLGFLRETLAEVGVELDERDMFGDYDLARMEQEEEPRPLRAALVTGDGENGRLYALQLIIDHV